MPAAAGVGIMGVGDTLVDGVEGLTAVICARGCMPAAAGVGIMGVGDTVVDGVEGLVGGTVVVGGSVNVNWSAAEAALVPPEVVTVISTVPVPAGEVAVILVSEFKVKLTAWVNPKYTLVAPVNPLPEIVIEFPPAGDPLLGEMLVMPGGARH